MYQDSLYQLYRIVDGVYPVIALPVIVVFLLGVGEYFITKSQKINSRLGMRLIIATVLIFLLVTGIYVLLGTVVGLNSGSYAN